MTTKVCSANKTSAVLDLDLERVLAQLPAAGRPVEEASGVDREAGRIVHRPCAGPGHERNGIGQCIAVIRIRRDDLDGQLRLRAFLAADRGDGGGRVEPFDDDRFQGC